MEFFELFLHNTGLISMGQDGWMWAWRQPLMIMIGLILVALAIKKGYEPLLLVPIGFGMVIGNIPYPRGEILGAYDFGSTFYWLYWPVRHEILPPLIFLGVGALTDFSALISNPRLVLLGAAAQAGVFVTMIGAIFLAWSGNLAGIGWLDFNVAEAAAIGIIGGADGPTAIYIATKLAEDMVGVIAISAYAYMSLVPVIQPPIMRLLTTPEERRIRMAPPRQVSRRVLILFPIVAFILCAMIIPQAMTLLGMLFFGNLLRVSGVTERLSRTVGGPFIDAVTVILGLSVGLATTHDRFLEPRTLVVFALGAFAFAVATATGVMFAKLMNKLSATPINPLVGSAGVSAVPMAARVSQKVAFEEDPNNYLLFHAMAPNVAGVIGTAVAAGVFIAMLMRV